MKERPILFSAPMVRAIQAGTKTQTRRIAKPRKYPSLLSGEWSDQYVLDEGNREWLMRDFPYGEPGDRLWVKETWRPRISHACSMDACDCDDVHVSYAADGQRSEGRYFTGYQIPDSWLMPKASKRGAVSPLFMPRWASRITLEITGVRVERLQDISEADAQHEGCSLECMTPTGDDSGSAIHGPGGFLALWVWVIEFKVLEGAA